MTDFYAKLLEELSEDVWEERPIDIKTFMYHKDWCNLPPHSDVQEDIIDRCAQFIYYDDLSDLYGPAEAARIEKRKARDILLILSKGAGKNSMSQIIFLYVIYQLLCLKDPAVYLKKVSGDNIDLVNMALNARSATNTFLKTFTTRLKNIEWFNGKYHARSSDVLFDKNITMHSLNSEHSSAEGMNVFYFLQDEAAGEVLEKATDMNDALGATVASRFPETGKGLVLSFARSKEDFMMTRWDDAVKDKETVHKSHTFKLDNSLPDGAEGNEFTIEWDEETATAYKYDNFFAMKLPTWEVNPTVTIEDFKMNFYRDPVDALMRFAATPPDSDENAFFKNHLKLERVFSSENGYNEALEDITIKPNDDVEYYCHVDLSRVADKTVVAMAHVRDWQVFDHGSFRTDPQPFVVVDLFRVWEPTKSDPVNHGEVAEFIVNLAKKFNIQLVTFDSWGIHGMVDYLNEVGVRAEKQSLARPEYQEFALTVGEERLLAPMDERLMKELKGLVIKNGKVDHPTANTYNDITEAVCGSIVGAIRNTSQDTSLEIITWESLQRREREQERHRADMLVKPPMPDEIDNWLKQLKGI